MFKKTVIDPGTYELYFQESLPVFMFEEGKFGDDRTQQTDPTTGYGHWLVRVTASDKNNREEQAIEVSLVAKDQPDAGFKDRVYMPNLHFEAYSTKTQRGVTTRWAADTMTITKPTSTTTASATAAATGGKKEG